MFKIALSAANNSGDTLTKIIYLWVKRIWFYSI